MDLLNTFLRHAAKYTSKVIIHVNVIDFEQSHGRASKDWKSLIVKMPQVVLCFNDGVKATVSLYMYN